jgi:hypothetical protein
VKSPKHKVGKTGFVEQRTFFNIFRSFDRLWIGYILVLQVGYFLKVNQLYLDRPMYLFGCNINTLCFGPIASSSVGSMSSVWFHFILTDAEQ